MWQGIWRPWIWAASYFCALFFVPALFCTANMGEKAHCPGPAEHGGFFSPLQAGEKNELFSSKHAYSWPIVSFDLGMGRLHEWALLSCYVYTVCELLKVARAPASSGRDYSAGMLGWRAGAAVSQMLFICSWVT